MADEAPICDVLCEATEYLSKLGSNLRTRTENLKERKIRRDKLQNAHAIQKAVNKVLLICELSKKSLENVEKEVKKIRNRVNCTQAPVDIGGKDDDNREAFHSFQYESDTLKIATKIPVKHYMSMKVCARKLSTATLNKYPVYYNCKLYRQRKKLQKRRLKKICNSDSENSECDKNDKSCRVEQQIVENLDDDDEQNRCEEQSVSSKQSNNNLEEQSDNENENGGCEEQSNLDTQNNCEFEEQSNNEKQNNCAVEEQSNNEKQNNCAVKEQSNNEKQNNSRCAKQKDHDMKNGSECEEQNDNDTQNNSMHEEPSNDNTQNNSESEKQNGKDKQSNREPEPQTSCDEHSGTNCDEDTENDKQSNDNFNDPVDNGKSQNISNGTKDPEEDQVLVNKSTLAQGNSVQCGKDQHVSNDKEHDNSSRDNNDQTSSKQSKTKRNAVNEKTNIENIKKRRKSCQKHVRFTVDSSSENEITQDAKSQEKENVEFSVLNMKVIKEVAPQSPPRKKRKLPFVFESESDSDAPLKISIDSDTEISKTNDNCPAKSDVEEKKTDLSYNDGKSSSIIDSDSQNATDNCEVKSDVPSKPLIKCVNISKLLKPDVVKLQEISVNKNVTTGSKPKPKTKQNAKKPMKKSTVRQPSVDSLEEKLRMMEEGNTDAEERVIKKFKMKEVRVQLTRLPALNLDLLKLYNIKKVTQSGSVICELGYGGKSVVSNNFDNVKEALLQDSDAEESITIPLAKCDQPPQNDTGQHEKSVALEKLDTDNSQPSQITAPIDNLESPKNKTSGQGKIINENEHVKSSLLNDSDSDQNEKSSELQNNTVETGEAQSKINDKENTPTKIKQALLNSSEDSDTSDIAEFKQKVMKQMILKQKSLVQSMKAKKTLLVYSSSEDESDSNDSDGKRHKHKRKRLMSHVSSSSSASKKQNNKHTSNEEEDSNEKAAASDDASKKNGSDTEQSNSNSSKMVRSKAKPGSSISNNSDTQDVNDKEVDRLANLNNLDKRSRRHISSEHGDVGRGSASREVKVIGEQILNAESASEAEDDSIGAEEEYPPPMPMDLNNGIGHISRDDLLGESDSSVSNERDKSPEIAPNMDESEEENVKLKRRKANAISSGSEAGSSRKKYRETERLSDFEDSDDENSEPAKKKKSKKVSESDGSASSDDGSKKKRRRIKQIDSDQSDSDGETEGRNKHGRKNIRKVMGKNQLEEATKKAAREEKERIARITERQKLYNNLEFDESGKPDEVVLEKVVLDFDPETKEPLIEVDRGLVKKLKPHQANGIKFMWDACFESVKRIKKDRGSGCILAHCMGLGKTLQVISLTHTLLTHGALTGVRRVLVVCPLSTVLNWVNEVRMWLKHAENDFDVDVYELSRHKQNSERAFQLGQWFECGGVCVLGYEMFRNLSADNNKKFKKKMLKIFQESLVDPGPDLVVCDEGHLLKNEKTSLSQSMNRVKTRRRIVLTGTPLQNNLKEYYCMVQFVKPNLLGKYNEYLNRFVNPITNGQYTDSTEHDIRVMKRRSHVLHKMLDGAVQRRDYGVLAPFLPPKHEYVLFITLSEVQVKLYQCYLDNYSRRPLPGKSSGFLFPDFQSLQRIWTHPLVLKYNSERYEIMQQKKREREEEDSEGSLVDFIDDDSTPEVTSTEESSDDSSEMSDDSRKKNKKKKTAKKNKVKDTRVAPRRGTRANPVEQDEEDQDMEVVEVKNENPTEWWIKLVSDDELEDMRNSHKLVLLFDILRQCETIGDKLLVFSQSLYSLDLIEHFLGKVDEATQEGRIDEKLGGHVGSWSPGIDYFRLDGSTSCENRSIWCKNFNKEDNPRARLFLISTRAGGLGINLVAANRVVIFDVSWNPSHDVQSIFRVYRFGQKKPCYIYRFLAMGTMEEKIYERQVTKQAISKRVIDEQQIDRHYAENDLAELYKFEPSAPAPRELPALPKDRLFAEMLREHEAQIYKYHEHDSLLENKEEETLTEEERKAAWEDFENEKNKPPPAPFPTAWPMHNGMVPGLLAQQQQQLAYAALAAMLRKDMPNINDNQIRDMASLVYNSNPGLMQKMSEIYKYTQPGMMNPAMMNSVMNPAASGMGGTSGLQYEPPWHRQQQQQQQMRLQQLMQQQNHMGAKYYAGGLGSRDPVAMALQQQRAREIMLGGGAGGAGGAGAGAGGAGRPRGRPPQARAPPAAHHDIVNLDSD